MISCPKCGHRDSKVTASYERNGFYERRRECNVCGGGFITREFSTKSITQILTDNQEQALATAKKLFGGR
ncbi:MAG: hypothetical protein CMO47_00415 [Verrucomicrobiales bacterium]|nr:hypothetical protein [Verrucomicrobiales bacterium]